MEWFEFLIVLCEKGKIIFCKYLDTISALWFRRFYIRSIMVSVAPFLGVYAAARLLGWVVDGIGAFLDRYAPTLFFAGLGIWLVGSYLNSRLKKLREKRRIEEEEKQKHDMEAYQKTEERTYRKVGKAVCSAAREMSSAGIVPPRRLSSIYAKVQTIPIMDGKGMLCQYLMEKSQDDVDTVAVAETMQTKIDQKLRAREILEVPPEFTYNGRIYSGLLIHQVEEDINNPKMIVVWATLTNEAYLQYVEDIAMDREAPSPSVDRRDTRYLNDDTVILQCRQTEYGVPGARRLCAVGPRQDPRVSNNWKKRGGKEHVRPTHVGTCETVCPEG